MSKAKPADQGVEVLTWLHPLDSAVIEAAAQRGEGTRSGIIRECVAMCLHFGLRPWRALAAREKAQSALASLDELEHAIRDATADDTDLLTMIECIRADLRSAYLPDGDPPTKRLKAPPERGPGRG
jgi:hypothetical protein